MATGNAIGRLKYAKGFHSIRKVVVTILENDGVSENVVAELVGA